MKTHGQHIVIIGGTRGLGLDLARAASANENEVTITGRSEVAAKEAAATISTGNVTGRACDLNDFDSLKALFADIETVDHLILAALDRDNNDIRNFRPDDAVRTATMKNVGYATAVSYALPKFSTASSIVMFGGLSADRPFPGSTTISMANAGLIGLMNSLAIQIAPTRVNMITPGVVDGTEAVAQADEGRKQAYDAMRERTPGKRLPTPQNIVDATFALIDNPGINATNLVVDAAMHLV